MQAAYEDLDNEVCDNIFRSLRQASGLSHDLLAKRCGVSKRALIFLEQGLYEQPLPRVVEFWLDEGGSLLGVRNSGIHISELSLVHGYEQFQEDTRNANRLLFGANFPDLSYGPGSLHPFTNLRLLINESGVGVARRLCVPQSTLNLWERRWRTQKSVPKHFQTALLAIGYSRFEVKRFVDGYIQWREANK